jgi:cell fate regulator YaaT (PSP1 superfamily)
MRYWTLLAKDNSDKNDITIYELEFKGSRKDYYASPDNLTVKPSEYVIVQADRGEHIGRVNRIGPRSIFPHAKELKSLIRHASYTDMQIMMDNKLKEEEAFKVCEKRIGEHGLNMKLVDVEYQFDGNKICFYFTADKRIDFRALVKDLAAEYRTRIELRQIGVRDEARRLGGMGVCGRPLCCKTFLSQFEPITSQMARDQNLSLSPSKISGLCGRLMCCLAYEEDFYRLQSDMLPQAGEIVEKNGNRYEVLKVDIFNECFVIRDGEDRIETININNFVDFKKVESAKKSEPDDIFSGYGSIEEGYKHNHEEKRAED